MLLLTRRGLLIEEPPARSVRFRPRPATIELPLVLVQGPGMGTADTASASNGSTAAVNMFVRVFYASGGNGPVNGRYTPDLTQ